MAQNEKRELAGEDIWTLLAKFPGASNAYDGLLEKGRRFLKGLERGWLEALAEKYQLSHGSLSDQELVDALCETYEHSLGGLLRLYTCKPTVTVSSTPDERISRMRERARSWPDEVTRVRVSPERLEELERRSGKVSAEISLRPMDTLASALEGFPRKEDVRRLGKRLKTEAVTLRELSEQLRHLHHTRLVKYGLGEGEFEDLPKKALELPNLLRQTAVDVESYLDKFFPTVLGRLEDVGPRRHPDQSRILDKIFEVVGDFTGSTAQDTLLSELITALSLPEDPAEDPPQDISAEALGKRRKRSLP